MYPRRHTGQKLNYTALLLNRNNIILNGTLATLNYVKMKPHFTQRTCNTILLLVSITNSPCSCSSSARVRWLFPILLRFVLFRASFISVSPTSTLRANMSESASAIRTHPVLEMVAISRSLTVLFALIRVGLCV